MSRQDNLISISTIERTISKRAHVKRYFLTSFSSLRVTFMMNNCNKYLTHLLFSLSNSSFAFTVHFCFILSFSLHEPCSWLT